MVVPAVSGLRQVPAGVRSSSPTPIATETIVVLRQLLEAAEGGRITSLMYAFEDGAEVRTGSTGHFKHNPRAALSAISMVWMRLMGRIEGSSEQWREAE
jgi:hypothetical protein